MCKLSKEEEYSIISRTMTNIRSLRMYVRGIYFEQLLDMQEAQRCYWRRREDAEREAAERAEREEKRQELLQLIAEEGFHWKNCLIGLKIRQNHVKRRCQKHRPSINLKKMVKLNTGPGVGVRQNRLMKQWKPGVLWKIFVSIKIRTA